MRHLLSVADLSCDELVHLVELSLRLKRERAAGLDHRLLSGRVLSLLFEKPSLRTRVSFESGFAHLGGTSIFLTASEVGLGKRESVSDFAKVVSTYVDLLAIRAYAHSLIEEISASAGCPVINALSDRHHPCQVLGDLCTIHEQFGRLDGIRLAFIGDANNVSHDLALASAQCGIDFVLASPAKYGFSPDFVRQCNSSSAKGSVTQERDPKKAVASADVIYTDVWISMGQEAEADERLAAFTPFQVNAALMAACKPDVRFFHCLPAHRGEEVTDEVIDGPQSIVLEQAANRLHAQKALMLWLLTHAR